MKKSDQNPTIEKLFDEMAQNIVKTRPLNGAHYAGAMLERIMLLEKEAELASYDDDIVENMGKYLTSLEDEFVKHLKSNNCTVMASKNGFEIQCRTDNSNFVGLKDFVPLVKMNAPLFSDLFERMIETKKPVEGRPTLKEKDLKREEKMEKLIKNLDKVEHFKLF